MVKIDKKSQLLSVDLFSGCGGFSFGLEKAGFRTVFANELNSSAAETFKKNLPQVEVINKDIRNIDFRHLRCSRGIENLHLLVAGPPCQGYSIAGRRRIDDPRNSMFMQVSRAIKELQPDIFIMENVKGLLSMDKGRCFQRILSEFGSLGYSVNYRVINAAHFGVPQSRERVFIVGTSKYIPEEELFPKRKNKTVTVREALSDLSFLDVNQTANRYKTYARSRYQRIMRKRSRELHNHVSPNHSKTIQKRFKSVPMGMNGKDALKRVGTNKHTYCKLNPKKPSRTLTTLPEDFIHYSRDRIPTVREMARLQSFPDRFIFCGPRTTGGARRKNEVPQYTQVGNAVPPLLAYAIGLPLKKVLLEHY